MKPLVEEYLPKQLIYDLGLYLQTCAHIEVSVCSLILTVETFSANNSILTKRFHELRKKPIGDLIRLLRAVAEQLDGEWSTFLVALSDWVDTYKLNRHIAAHGALYIDKNNSSEIRVLYTHVKKDHGQKVYYPEETVLTQKLVMELIEDADRILRSVVSLDESIRRGDVKLAKA